jgi:hypothetical protein
MKIEAITLVITMLAAAALFLPAQTQLVYAAGSPDSYGDCILLFQVWQNNTGTYLFKGAVSSSNYTGNFQFRVDAGPAIMFNVTVCLNYAFATSISEAVENTRVYMNISGGGAVGWTNHLLASNNGGTDCGTYWSVTWSDVWNEASHPAAETTYTVTVLYQAYY